MRPSALESLYRDLELKYGYQERTLPAQCLIRPLNVEDVKQVSELEAECFPPSERASEEKIEYRLKEAPELCAGIFRREYSWTPGNGDEAGVASFESNLKSETLVAYIHAVKAPRGEIDAAMELGGHKEASRVVMIHSVAVSPAFRGQGLAHILLKDYIQRMFAMYTADGIEILAHKPLVPFYEKHGFMDEGASKSQFGDGGWNAMYLAFDAYDEE